MTPTLAEQLTADRRRTHAKEAIIATLKDYQSRITGIRSPQHERAAVYQKIISDFEEIRGGKLLYPYLASGIGNGALVELADGSIKYDFITGIGVHYLGHSHPGLIEKMIDAAMADTVMQGNLLQDTASHEFSRALLKAATKNGAPLKHVFLCTSGVMAGENALKMAFQKKSPADRVLCFKNCFMGRTITMAQTTDNPAYRVGLPKTLAVDYVPFYDPKNHEASIKAAIDSLKKHLQAHPQKHAAMCFELILGEGGFYPGHRDFFLPLMEILKKHEIPVLIDEVQTFARTTEPFAFQHFGLDAFVDAVWIGKASQACATLFTDEMNPKPGLISQTYTASTTAIAAGHYILTTLMTGGFFGAGGRIARLHEEFKSRLNALASKYPKRLSGPFGMGAMIGFTVFDGEPDKVKKFARSLFDAGVIAFYCGKNPTRMRFLPPVGCLSTKDIDAVFEILEKTLADFDW